MEENKLAVQNEFANYVDKKISIKFHIFCLILNDKLCIIL